VADQLMERILDGSLAAGDRLPSEGDLSAAFGVSRSTTREALRVLASRDLIETLRGTTGGSFVARVNAAQVSDYLETSLGLMSGSSEISLDQMLEARDLLEVPAARLAATRRTQQHLDDLASAIHNEKRLRDRGDKFREHRHFHGIILEASGNGLLKLMNDPVFAVLRAQFWRPEMPSDYWQAVDHDHQELHRLLTEQDVEGAVTAMREHLVRIRPAYRVLDIGTAL
jgi:DNA-binding FadR family transcriptional regulator